MQIYNAGGLDNNQRFVKGIFVGLAAAIVCGILYGLLISIVRIQMEIFYILIGWCVGSAIRKFSHGVGTRYCVLGAICTFLAIVIGDLCTMYGLSGILAILATPASWSGAFTLWMQMHLSTSINNLLGVLFRVAGIYFGYHYSSLF